ncbi:MAG: amino acid kinase family protein [Pseudonocardia sp.]
MPTGRAGRAGRDAGPAVTASARAGTAVVAVGGNALTRPDQLGSAEEIAANAADMARALADLVRAGRHVAVVHGNGPQVGNLALQQDALAGTVPPQPLHQLSAMTQGQLGGALARAIDAECGIGAAVCVVTHVTVDPADPAFVHPTKPIGPFLDRLAAEELARDRGWQVVEDAGRGWRRVVPSPRPVGIVELAAVGTLLEAGRVVLAAGGGGVAVSTGPDGRLAALDAVIDKDLAAAALATAVGADELYLLTGVDCVLLDHGSARERPVHRLEPEEAERHLAAGQFPPGSMGPKITAALNFLRHGGHRAIITSARLLRATADGMPGTGTCIERSPVPMAHLS